MKNVLAFVSDDYVYFEEQLKAAQGLAKFAVFSLWNHKNTYKQNYSVDVHRALLERHLSTYAIDALWSTQMPDEVTCALCYARQIPIFVHNLSCERIYTPLSPPPREHIPIKGRHPKICIASSEHFSSQTFLSQSPPHWFFSGDDFFSRFEASPPSDAFDILCYDFFPKATKAYELGIFCIGSHLLSPHAPRMSDIELETYLENPYTFAPLSLPKLQQNDAKRLIEIIESHIPVFARDSPFRMGLR